MEVINDFLCVVWVANGKGEIEFRTLLHIWPEEKTGKKVKKERQIISKTLWTRIWNSKTVELMFSVEYLVQCISSVYRQYTSRGEI